MDYKGFKCITGVVGVEMKGIVENVFKDLGVPFDPLPAGPPHYLINGKICEVPSQGGMKQLLLEAGGSSVEVEKIMGAMSRALKWKEPSPGVTLFDWIRQYSHHQGILNIFQTLVSAALLVNVHEISAKNYFEFIKELKGVRFFGYSPNGSITLPESLGQLVYRFGGATWTDSRVSQIITEKGVVRGALIQRNGTDIEVRASAVISNTGPVKTAELAGRENFDKDYLKELYETIIPAPVVVIQAALDKPLFNQNHLLVTGGKSLNAVYQPSLVCPKWAPEGKHLMIAGAAPASSVGPINGKKEIDICLEDLRNFFPDFDKIAKILITSVFKGDWPAMHTWPGRDMPQKTPVINLYNVGDGVKQPGYTGLPSAVKSGVLAAEEIKQRIRILTGSKNRIGTSVYG
jgi:phytoene dehydrogenase-like protein